MKKIIIAILSFAMLMQSCVEGKEFTKEDGTTFKAEPYGWANKETKKIDGVKYEVSPLAIVCTFLTIETFVGPVLITGWGLFEPVRYEEPKDDNR